MPGKKEKGKETEHTREVAKGMRKFVFTCAGLWMDLEGKKGDRASRHWGSPFEGQATRGDNI